VLQNIYHGKRDAYPFQKTLDKFNPLAYKVYNFGYSIQNILEKEDEDRGEFIGRIESQEKEISS
jgi:hypothetical protein